jgi:hypothetical protein
VEHKKPLTDGYNGLTVVEIIETAQKSLRNSGSREQIIYGCAAETVRAAS